MSDEPFVTDPGFGEFIVSASGYYDHEAGVWWKPWTDKPARAVIGYVAHLHPSEAVLAYTYLMVDVEQGAIVWYYGVHGDPAVDNVVGSIPYQVDNGE